MDATPSVGMERRFLFACGLAILLVPVGAFAVANYRPPASSTIQFEYRKLLVQFLLITAVGALIAVLFDRVKHRLDAAARRRQYTAQIITSILKDLDGVYRDVKLTRRLLRLSPDVASDEHKERLLALNAAQQDLEQLLNDVEAYTRRVPTLTSILEPVDRMNKYVRSIWSEWEKADQQAGGRTDVSRMPKLASFVAHASTNPTSDFVTFRRSYKDARQNLINSLGNEVLGAAGTA